MPLIHPFSPVADQISKYFPAEAHPYRRLEDRIGELLTADSTLLDIGCGRTAPVLTKFSDRCDQLLGIDVVDFTVSATNMHLYTARVEAMPQIEARSVDVAYSRSVMEHISDVDGALQEISRVLKPGGRYIFLTANRYDYVSIIASLIPNRLHPLVVKLTEGREEEDTFPTCYKINSKRAITTAAKLHGYAIDSFDRWGQYPGYFRFSRPLFWLASQYERLICRTDALSALRGWIYCELVKPK